MVTYLDQLPKEHQYGLININKEKQKEEIRKLEEEKNSPSGKRPKEYQHGLININKEKQKEETRKTEEEKSSPCAINT